MKGSDCFMKPNVSKVLKLAVKIVTIAVPILAEFIADKKLDDRIAKKASEAVAEAMKTK